MNNTSTLYREQVNVEGTELSYLNAGDPFAPPLLLLHGTFWSRVWQPVLPQLAEARSCFALDLPGFGFSDGELDVAAAGIPRLAETVLEAANALGLETFALAGHDIGGGIAQHIAAHSGRVNELLLVNSVMFDSWPVPAVAKFQDPTVRAQTTAEELYQARTRTMQLTVARKLSDEEIADYTSPWQDPARCRSWMAMAAAADPKYTTDLVPALKEAAIPTRLVWGRDDDFQKIDYARHYVQQIPGSDLVEVHGKHLPTEDSPREVSEAILEHLTS